MDFRTFLGQIARFGVTAESVSVLEEQWAESQALLPEGRLPFLQPEHVGMACDLAGFEPDLRAATLRTASIVETEPALRALAWHCSFCLYQSSEYPSDHIRRWPSLVSALPSDGGLLYVLVLFAQLPGLRRFYQGHGIPETVLRDTLFDVQRWLPEYRDSTGQWGLFPRRLTWLRNHLRGEMFHLVRLQFQPGRFARGATVFRQRRNGSVLALSDAGVAYRSDGQIDGAGGARDPQPWTATLEEDDRGVAGYPISPCGYALPERVYLPKDEWDQVLAPGDSVLHLHIPTGGPMDFGQCGDSLRAATQFFPKHLPEFPFRAFACSSWLLDNQLQDLLSPESNIVRFQREMYLLPSGGSGESTLERVFGRVPTDMSDPQQAPRDTSLRRVLIDHVLGGGHIRSGRSFLLPEDLDWGGQVYLRHRALTESTRQG